MSSPTRCGLCEAPAVLALGIIRTNGRPDVELWRRPAARCATHTPPLSDWLGTLMPGQVLVVQALDGVARCACGLPVDHRTPPSREGRPCRVSDLTVRFPALPGVPA